MTRSLRDLREVHDAATLREIGKSRADQVRRAKRKALLAFRDKYGAMPRYPRGVLEWCIQWLEARRHRTWETEIAEVVHYMRRDAAAYFGTGEPIANRGVARICRELGCSMRRGNRGMIVVGIKLA